MLLGAIMAQATVQMQKTMREIEKVPHMAVVIFNEVLRTRVFTIGAAVAFFLLMSLVPLLMVSFAMLSALHLPNLLQQILDVMALLVPPTALSFVKTLLASMLTAHPARILSIGALSYIWAASGSFSALIEALNIAYDVPDTRSWIRDKLQALLLTFVCGCFGIVSLLSVLAGPGFIHFLSTILPIPSIFNLIWPPVRFALMFSTFVINVMLLYHFGPNRKTPLRTSLPGAALAVVLWFAGSLGLSFYITHFSDYSATYGSLGAIIVLMLWLYLSSVSILVGAELNAELWKQSQGCSTCALDKQMTPAPVARLTSPQPPVTPSLHVQPAVHVQRVPGDVARHG